MTETSTTVQQGFRAKLIDAIVFRIGQDVENSMPSDIPTDTRKAILGEVLPNSRFVLSRLTNEELQDEGHIERQIESTLRIINGFVRRVRAQRRRSQ